MHLPLWLRLTLLVPRHFGRDEKERGNRNRNSKTPATVKNNKRDIPEACPPFPIPAARTCGPQRFGDVLYHPGSNCGGVTLEQGVEVGQVALHWELQENAIKKLGSVNVEVLPEMQATHCRGGAHHYQRPEAQCLFMFGHSYSPCMPTHPGTA